MYLLTSGNCPLSLSSTSRNTLYIKLKRFVVQIAREKRMIKQRSTFLRQSATSRSATRHHPSHFSCPLCTYCYPETRDDMILTRPPATDIRRCRPRGTEGEIAVQWIHIIIIIVRNPRPTATGDRKKIVYNLAKRRKSSFRIQF